MISADPSNPVLVWCGEFEADCRSPAPYRTVWTETGRYDSGVTDSVEPGFAWQLRLSKPVIAHLNGAAAGVGLVFMGKVEFEQAAALKTPPQFFTCRQLHRC